MTAGLRQFAHHPYSPLCLSASFRLSTFPNTPRDIGVPKFSSVCLTTSSMYVVNIFCISSSNTSPVYSVTYCAFSLTPVWLSILWKTTWSIWVRVALAVLTLTAFLLVMWMWNHALKVSNRLLSWISQLKHVTIVKIVLIAYNWTLSSRSWTHAQTLSTIVSIKRLPGSGFSYVISGQFPVIKPLDINFYK